MNKVQWHWMENHDYPKDGQKVWCVTKGFCFKNSYIQQSLYFSNDLYKLDKYNFNEYKKKHHKGFYDYDSEVGYYEVRDVICWCELPDLPEQLKEAIHD